jgi:hypothetical protein
MGLDRALTPGGMQVLRRVALHEMRPPSTGRRSSSVVSPALGIRGPRNEFFATFDDILGNTKVRQAVWHHACADQATLPWLPGIDMNFANFRRKNSPTSPVVSRR